MGGGQNYGPLLGALKGAVWYYTRDPKRDPNCDNHPCVGLVFGDLGSQQKRGTIPFRVGSLRSGRGAEGTEVKGGRSRSLQAHTKRKASPGPGACRAQSRDGTECRPRSWQASASIPRAAFSKNENTTSEKRTSEEPRYVLPSTALPASRHYLRPVRWGAGM